VRLIACIAGIGLWAGLITVGAGFQADATGEGMFKELPEGWRVEKSLLASEDQVAAISRKLGCKIVQVSNTILSFRGQRIQVNVLRCQRPGDAEGAFQAVLQAHNGISDYAWRKDNSVVEFVRAEIGLVRRARQALGFTSVQPSDISGGLFKTLPVGWEVKESFVVPESETAAIGRKLGGRIRKLSNTFLSVQGKQLQVNSIECIAVQDAERVHKSILAVKGHPAFCLRRDDLVVEFVGDEVSVAIKAAYELGLKPKPAEAQYKISFDAAPIERGDFMSWNRLFNLFVAMEERPDDEDVRSQITELSGKFQFAQEINLRTCGSGKTKSAYRFKPDATRVEVTAHGDVTRYAFSELPRKFGVPSVSIEATVTAQEGGFTASSRGAGDGLLGPTEFWPADDLEIKALAKKITAPLRSGQDKVHAILEWLTPGKNIKFGGPVTGSRYGVKKVLAQGFGQCWDFADCFVTLGRAAGVPCRQVAGWLYGASGHIWAEVLYEGTGWQQVDPTGGGLMECGIYHIAYVSSEDGSMPILYVSWPKMEYLNWESQE
jgi:hypothetical protein